jgi:hypothetical protein
VAPALSLSIFESQPGVPPRGVNNNSRVESMSLAIDQRKGFDAARDESIGQAALYCETFETRCPDIACAVKEDLIKAGATEARCEPAGVGDSSDRSADLPSAGGGQTQVVNLRSLQKNLRFDAESFEGWITLWSEELSTELVARHVLRFEDQNSNARQGEPDGSRGPPGSASDNDHLVLHNPTSQEC